MFIIKLLLQVYMPLISPSVSLSICNNRDEVQCSDHMCPVRVHWHVKTNYLNQWRVKLTISNYNYQRNFSNWNMLVQHPGFIQPATIYSFNSAVLPTVGFGGNYCSTFLSTIDSTWLFHISKCSTTVPFILFSMYILETQ